MFFLRQVPSLSAPAQWSPSTTVWRCRACWTPSQTLSYITSAKQDARLSSSRGVRPSCSSCSPTSGTWGEVKLEKVSFVFTTLKVFRSQRVLLRVVRQWSTAILWGGRSLTDKCFKRVWTLFRNIIDCLFSSKLVFSIRQAGALSHLQTYFNSLMVVECIKYIAVYKPQ